MTIPAMSASTSRTTSPIFTQLHGALPTTSPV